MKKVITIGDIHGRNYWKNFADISHLLKADPETAGTGTFVPEYDYYVFIGDYVDSFTVPSLDIIYNLLDIIKLKTLYPNNVILIWGNHDVEYWKNLPWVPANITMTGFRSEVHFQLYEIFNKNVELFQLAFQISNYIWTHAGVHAGWYKHYFLKEYNKKDNLTVAEKLNDAFLHRLSTLYMNDLRRGGIHKVGGPLWCDKQLTSKKPLKGYHQIVGHTPTNGIKHIVINKNTSITYCDILDERKYDILNNTDKDRFHILNI